MEDKIQSLMIGTINMQLLYKDRAYFLLIPNNTPANEIVEACQEYIKLIEEFKAQKEREREGGEENVTNTP